MRPASNPPEIVAGSLREPERVAPRADYYAPRKSALRKYWNIFRASLVERMAYRADFFLSTLLRFIPCLATRRPPARSFRVNSI